MRYQNTQYFLLIYYLSVHVKFIANMFFGFCSTNRNKINFVSMHIFYLLLCIVLYSTRNALPIWSRFSRVLIITITAFCTYQKNRLAFSRRSSINICAFIYINLIPEDYYCFVESISMSKCCWKSMFFSVCFFIDINRRCLLIDPYVRVF